MPKKQRNAFYFFMLDKQQQLREQGKVVSMKDMPVIASAEWNVSDCGLTLIVCGRGKITLTSPLHKAIKQTKYLAQVHCAQMYVCM